jgi:lipopolysaccharide/colanic/teichoic acid biosynthesis glycosyltransferase
MAARHSKLKRGLDLVAAASLLVIVLPLLLACAVLVRWNSHGPVIYRQLRCGLDGKPFTLYKLRTMEVDAERLIEALVRSDPAARDEWDRYRRLTRDPRLVPRVGGPIRRASLDELPQLWNVVRGDMSMVGPRPLELPSIDELPEERVAVRSSVRPGLTGLWQVSGRSEMTLEQMLALDEAYVLRWSILLDLQLIARTPLAVIRARGAY